MSGGVEDVFSQVGAWRDEGERMALATVIATWGSSPRQVGTQMAVMQSGRIVGSVSGGCVESAVAELLWSSRHAGNGTVLHTDCDLS
jgi:xanthine/CO dehydrogenase XdhC/CoxF family maturation factor